MKQWSIHLLIAISYQKFSPTDRYKIGKWAADFGTASTLKKFKCSFPNLKESNFQSICQKYLSALKQKRDPVKTLSLSTRRRHLMLGKLYKMMQYYLRAVRRQRSVISKGVAISVGNALIKRLPEMNLDHFEN